VGNAGGEKHFGIGMTLTNPDGEGKTVFVAGHIHVAEC
jgi:hypothetical protein